MLVDVEDEDWDAAPNAALVVRVGLIDAELLGLHVPGEHRPATRRHSARGQIRDKVLP